MHVTVSWQAGDVPKMEEEGQDVDSGREGVEPIEA